MIDPRLRVIRASENVTADELVGRLDRPVRVLLADAQPVFAHQVASLAIVEILARLFPRIKVVCAGEALAHPDLPPGPARLAERFTEARRRGHPPEPFGRAAPLTVVVGSSEAAADVYIDGCGWQSYVGRRPSQLVQFESTVPIGPLCAAARGASQVFQDAFAGLLDDAQLIDADYWSALDYQAASEPRNMVEPQGVARVEAAFVGLGSVGGAAVYALRHVPSLDGFLILVDPQRFELRNYVRALLASRQLAKGRSSKVSAAAFALRHQPLHLLAKQRTVEQWLAAESPDYPAPLILCSVDSIESRRAVQDFMPLEVIDAACSATNARISAHRTDDGACLYCLYLPDVLNTDLTLLKQIVRATGITDRRVAEMLVTKAALTDEELQGIAGHRDVSGESYAAYRGRLLIELYQEQLVYAETRVGGDREEIAVASPFVSALAGFLLAGEALKAASAELQPYRLGCAGELLTEEGATASKYEESLFSAPQHALLVPIPRQGSACLCNDSRRLELMKGRYVTHPGGA